MFVLREKREEPERHPLGVEVVDNPHSAALAHSLASPPEFPDATRPADELAALGIGREKIHDGDPLFLGEQLL